MEITRVKIGLCDGDDRVKAYASITLDHCSVIHGLRLTHSEKGYFLFMPGRKRADGTYVDMVHALNNETRQLIQEKVVAEYEKIAGEAVTRPKPK
jgi:stage V sporulation protein G